MKKTKLIDQQCMRTETRKLLSMGLIRATTWGSKRLDTQRLKIRTQVAHEAGKKKHALLSMYLEMSDIEVQHELAVFWAQACWVRAQNENMYTAWKRQIFEANTESKVRGPAGAVHREQPHLQIKWPMNLRSADNNCGGNVEKQVIKEVEERHWSQRTEEKNHKHSKHGVWFETAKTFIMRKCARCVGQQASGVEYERNNDAA